MAEESSLFGDLWKWYVTPGESGYAPNDYVSNLGKTGPPAQSATLPPLSQPPQFTPQQAGLGLQAEPEIPSELVLLASSNILDAQRRKTPTPIGVDAPQLALSSKGESSSPQIAPPSGSNKDLGDEGSITPVMQPEPQGEATRQMPATTQRRSTDEILREVEKSQDLVKEKLVELELSRGRLEELKARQAQQQATPSVPQQQPQKSPYADWSTKERMVGGKDVPYLVRFMTMNTMFNPPGSNLALQNYMATTPEGIEAKRMADAKAKMDMLKDTLETVSVIGQRANIKQLEIDSETDPDRREVRLQNEVREFADSIGLDIDAPIVRAYEDNLRTPGEAYGGMLGPEIVASDIPELQGMKSALLSGDPEKIATAAMSADAKKGFKIHRSREFFNPESNEVKDLDSLLDYWKKRGDPITSTDELREKRGQSPLEIRGKDDLADVLDFNPAWAKQHKITTKPIAEKKELLRPAKELEREYKDKYSDPYEDDFGNIVQKNLTTGEIKIKQKSEAEDSGPKLNLVLSLKDQFQKQSKDYEAIEKTFANAQEAVNLYASGGPGSKQAWQALNVMFQRTIDPTSVVRESEFARTEGFQSYLDRVKLNIERMKTGEATPDLVQEVFENIKALRNAAQDGQARRVKNYEAIATEYKINPWLITGAVKPPETKYRINPETKKREKWVPE